jgi:hypothetical protein
MTHERTARALSITVSAVFVVLSVLLIALWARSYRWSDTLLGLKRNTGLGVGLVSENGQLVAVGNAPLSLLYQISQWSVRSVAPRTEQRPIQSLWGFGYVYNSREMGLGVPHWFPVIVFTAVATFPWLEWRFSLRALWIVTTLVALALGLTRWARGT